MCQLHCDDCPLLCSWPVGKERQYNLVWLTMAKIFGEMLSHLLQAKNASSMSSQNRSAVELWWSDCMDRWATLRHICNAQSTLVMAVQQFSLAWIHMEGFTDLYIALHFCTDSGHLLSLWSRPADFFPRISPSLILYFSSQEQLCMMHGTRSFHRGLQLGRDHSISPSDSSSESALSEVDLALLMTGKWMTFLPTGNTLAAVPAEVLCLPVNSENGGCLSSLSLLNSSPLRSIFNICG